MQTNKTDETRNVNVYSRKLYGRMVYYVNNEKGCADLLRELTNTKCLTERHITILKKLGFNIIVDHEIPDLLDRQTIGAMGGRAKSDNFKKAKMDATLKRQIKEREEREARKRSAKKNSLTDVTYRPATPTIGDLV